MVVFKKKNIITTKSIGEDLQRARKALNLTMEAVERRVGIGKQYLQALENNDFELLPGEVYAKNWLLKYARFLGLSWSDISRKYEREVAKFNFWQDTKLSASGVSGKKLMVLPKLLKRAFLFLVVIVVVGYVGAHVYSLLSPPSLEVLYPESDFVTQNSTIKILGKVGKDVFWLGLNDKEVAMGNDGYFSIDMDLNTGLNIIKFEARKSYGRSTIKYRRIIVE